MALSVDDAYLTVSKVLLGAFQSGYIQAGPNSMPAPPDVQFPENIDDWTESEWATFTATALYKLF